MENKPPHNKQSVITKRQIISEAWRRGDIAPFKLDSAQKDLDTIFKGTKEKITVLLSSRRWGKTYAATVFAIETCLKKPRSIVKFLAPTGKQIEDIITSIIPQITDDCPPDFKPEYLKSKHTFVFKNGSKLQLAGSESGNIERLRGSFAHLCIIDEAQNCKDLTNAIRSVLIPTTTNTKGKIIIIGTPPKDYEHDFLKFVEEAEVQGTLIRKTIYDNPRITADEIEQIVRAYPGGVDHPDFRREYLCEMVKDEQSHVIPEFTEQLEKEITKVWPRPDHYEYYEAMDLGFKDLTGVLFGYYDFKHDKIVVVDELAINFQEQYQDEYGGLSKLVDQIREKEALHFTDPITGEKIKPVKRVSDINYIVTDQIRRLSDREINFIAARKDDKEAAINEARMFLSSGKVIIDPRCKTLLYHLKNAKWHPSKKNVYTRGADGSHYDLLDAFLYLIRSINYNKNPVPAYHNTDLNNLFKVKQRKTGNFDENLAALFNRSKAKPKTTGQQGNDLVSVLGRSNIPKKRLW